MINLKANWPAPPNISALATFRTSGFSEPPFDSNNLALHVGDNSQHVEKNRHALRDSLQLPNKPAWLEQTHSNRCVLVEEEENRCADAAVTRDKTQVLAIMTADCLPILLTNREGSEIAAIHAGWRGLVNGVIENTLTKLESKPETLMAWIGPSICQACYEVGEDVVQACQEKYNFLGDAFKEKNKKYLANLPRIAQSILNSKDISAVFHSKACTFENKNKYYSYRREAQTGRIASLIWFND